MFKSAASISRDSSEDLGALNLCYGSVTIYLGLLAGLKWESQVAQATGPTQLKVRTDVSIEHENTWGECFLAEIGISLVSTSHVSWMERMELLISVQTEVI